jgi:nucleoside-diphosphate-sugar epimerase/predicted dehydrogenase
LQATIERAHELIHASRGSGNETWRAFVTGGTGLIGRALVRELSSRRWQVRVLARSAARAAHLPPAVGIIRGGLEDDDALREGVRDAHVVFHLGAATSGNWDRHRESTVEGTRRVLAACREAGVRRLVHASSLVVYDKRGRTPESVLDEGAPLLASTPSVGAYARGKLDAERLVLEHSRCSDFRSEVVIVRIGLVYGADRLTFPHLGELFGTTRVAYGAPSLLLPLVELASCADALIRVATAPAAAGQVYNVVDSCSVTRRDYLRALEAAAGYGQRVIYLPARPCAAAAGALARLTKIATGRATGLSAEKVLSRAVETRYDTTRLQRDTGWQPLRELDEGLARSSVAVRRSAARKIVRAGIIGAGMIARVHVAALRRIPGVQVAGVLDPDLDAARRLAIEAGGAPAFDNSDQFYEQANPQIVHVLTPPQSHAAVAREALRHKAHLLLEKPATTSVEDCDELVAAAAADDLTIGVDETVAWDPLVRRARAALMYGHLGDLVGADVFMGYDLNRGGRLQRILNDAASWERHLGGGPLEDLLAHPLSVVRSLCGPLSLRHAHCMTTGRLPGDFPDELRLHLGDGQVSALIGLSLSARPDEFLVTVRGTRATVHIDVQNMLFDCVTPLPGPRAAVRGARTVRSALGVLGQTAWNGLSIALRRTLPPASPIHLIRAHYAALAQGSEEPAPLARARADIAVARAIWP